MEEQDQKQPLKRIRFEEEDDEDRISELPDSLLVEILSRLPSTKHAIRTGAVSKRWKHLWTLVPDLIFKGFESPLTPDFYSFFDKTLTQCRQFKLQKFRVHSYCNHKLAVSRIHSWIRYAVNRNVEDLHLDLWGLPEFPLDQFVLINSCFTNLTLSGCMFNHTGTIRFETLTSLRISNVKLDEDMIEKILSGSPVLETLVLKFCYGYRRLNITSKSVKNLVFSAHRDFCDLKYDHADIIEINAPNILTLKIEGYVELRKLLLLNVSSLVTADFDHIVLFGHYYETASEEAEEEMLKGFILNLLHVKDLKIGICCSKVFNCLKAKGFISPSNLKVLDVNSSSLL